MKVFISQPMKDRSKEEILKEREVIIQNINNEFPNEKIIILDSYFENYDGKKPLNWLAESLHILAKCDLAYFGKGWQNARGCIIEHKCAVDYGYKVKAID